VTVFGRPVTEHKKPLPGSLLEQGGLMQNYPQREKEIPNCVIDEKKKLGEATEKSIPSQNEKKGNTT